MKRKQGVRVQTAVTGGQGAELILPGEKQAWNVPREKDSGRHGKGGVEMVRGRFNCDI